MKKKINIIDLDKTLIPYNSFTHFVIYFMTYLRSFLPILYLSFLRIIGILHRDTYQKRILLLVRKTPNYEKKMQKFSLILFQDIKKPVLSFIQKNTDENTINVLCTASPEDYVLHLCKMLKGWRCLCSILDKYSGSFYHMYGPNKLKSLKKLYQKDSYNYQLAISDSKTDNDLLRLFEKAFIIKKNNIIKLY